MKRSSKKKIDLPYIHRVQKKKQNQDFENNRSTIILIVQRLVKIQISNNIHFGKYATNRSTIDNRSERLCSGIFEEN